MKIILLVLGICTIPNLAFYHENVTKILAPSGLRNESLFGFSVAFQQMDAKLVVSAPRADHVGLVLLCDVTSGACTAVTTNIDKNESESQKYIYNGEEGTYPDLWLGTTVAAGSNFYMACAPRTIIRKLTSIAVLNVGLCLVGNQTGVMNPMKRMDYADRMNVEQKRNTEQWMDTVGWSIHVNENDDTTIVGGPSHSEQSRGTALIYKTPLDTQAIPEVMKSYLYEDLDQISYNFGYSVSTGHYFSTNTSDVVYAISSTYGYDGPGKVVFYKSGVRKPLAVLVDQEDLVGSMFGAALCSLELNGDSRTDLLVGAAALAAGGGYNSGAVHVYVTADFVKFKRSKTIYGSQSGGFFGLAISNMGDLDGDGKDEVVVAAPFEDEGRGAVYLYMGSELDGSYVPKCAQKIAGTGTQGYFGYSLAPLTDLRDNGMHGLVVGSPGENSVSIYKHIPIFSIQLIEVIPDLKEYVDKDNFVFKSCINVTRVLIPRTITADLELKVDIKHPDAKIDGQSQNYVSFKILIEDKGGQQICKDIKIIKPLKGDNSKPIKYKMHVIQVNDPRVEPYDSSRGLLAAPLIKQGQIWTTTDCELPGQCKPAITITLTSSILNPYVVGSTSVETLSIEVTNTNETAYKPSVEVQVTGMRISSTTAGCQGNRTTLVCELQGTLPKNANRTIQINLDASSLISTNSRLAIHTHVYDEQNNIKLLQDGRSIMYSLKYDVENILFKRSSEKHNVLVKLNTNEVYNTGKRLEHKYMIQNQGVTHWNNLQTLVTLEKQPFLQIMAIQMYSKEHNEPCQMDPIEETHVTMTFKCPLGRLDKDEFKNLDVIMTVIPNTLGDVLSTRNITVKSNIVLLLNDHGNKTDSFECLLMLEKTVIPIWFILVGILLGLLILSLTILILYECGFLKRRKKKDLRLLKRRASVRMSMRESSQRRSGSSNRSFQKHVEDGGQRRQSETCQNEAAVSENKMASERETLNCQNNTNSNRVDVNLSERSDIGGLCSVRGPHGSDTESVFGDSGDD
ncbi:integrin alpha-PS3-like [Plutella xylostella]|uniref:integrin alpha-PS3-like n=1 Tax=Plutella xylostella TaxID=51655 RepID=UPI002032B75B|nr:integrin alpha-PS3-like [Plutella xylostella]